MPEGAGQHLILMAFFSFCLGYYSLHLNETSRLLGLITDGKEILSDGCDEEVFLDFLPEPAWLGFKDPIVELHSKGMKHREIGKALGCPRNWVTLALKQPAEDLGIPYVDGRKLKKRLDKPTLPIKIAEQAKALMDEGWLLQEMAKKLGFCPNWENPTPRIIMHLSK